MTANSPNEFNITAILICVKLYSEQTHSTNILGNEQRPNAKIGHIDCITKTTKGQYNGGPRSSVKSSLIVTILQGCRLYL